MSGPSFEIRRLRQEDLALARALNAMFGAAFAEPEMYAAEPPPDPYLERLLGKDDVFALVAVRGDEVVGGLVAYALEKLERARSELYVYDLAVAAPWRRRGVATALIERLRGLAAEAGAWVIFVQADRGDMPAIALYEGLGRREEVLHFDIAVHSSASSAK